MRVLWTGEGFQELPEEDTELSPELEADLKEILDMLKPKSDGSEILSADEFSLFLEEAVEVEEEHAGIQYTLIRMGRTLGYDIYIPPCDRAHVLDGQRFGELALEILPDQGISPEALGLLEAVDVIWLRPSDGSVECLFEIENTGASFSGLPRLSDLTKTGNMQHFMAYIVAADECEDDLLGRLKQEPFGDLTGNLKYILYSSLNASHRALEKYGISLSTLNEIACIPR